VRRRLVAALLASALVAGCVGPEHADRAEGTGRATTTTAPTTTTTLPLPAPVPLQWTPCHGSFRCASMTVPVDYAAPTGPTLQIALIERPADDPAQRIGTLVMNPGGPGASGVRRVQRGFQVSPEVARRFDIIGFDPRGVGASTPITCGSQSVPAFQHTDLGATSGPGRDALEAAARAVAQDCAATEGARLGHLGTVDVVRDLEVLRRDLGEAQLTYVGLSYGTLIGQLWAEAYPTSVRAMVLDGLQDTSVNAYATSKDQLDAIDATFAAIGQACASDASCPLREVGVAGAYDQLHARLEAATAPVAGVGPTQLAYAYFYATYDQATWPRFWRALGAGLQGDLSQIASLADAFDGLVGYAPFALISCLDAPHPTGLAAWRRSARQGATASPRFGAVLANQLLPCAFWPPATLVPHTVIAPGTPPILVVGSTGDVATPYPQAVRVARTLQHGLLLTVHQEGHIALDESACANRVITRYLVDLAAPPPDPGC
jgi:pimeloyl-ACP methyl ester carboxylesterase